MIPKEFEDEYLKQGFTLETSQTRRWSKQQWDENDARERCYIFANFSRVDDGKGRVFVLKCSDSSTAAKLVSEHNSKVRENRAKKQHYKKEEND